MKKFKTISMRTIILMVLTLVVIGCSMHYKKLNTIKSLEEMGHSLIKINTDWKSNENSTIDGIANVGDGLYSILKNHQVSHEQLQVKGMIGDCLGLFDTDVTHSIEIISPNDNLCIRLRYDVFRSPNVIRRSNSTTNSRFQYHIYGYSGGIE